MKEEERDREGEEEEFIGSFHEIKKPTSYWFWLSFDNYIIQ